jgi:hypothetical protein
MMIMIHDDGKIIDDNEVDRVLKQNKERFYKGQAKLWNGIPVNYCISDEDMKHF